VGNLPRSNQLPRTTQPGHPSVDKRNEYRPNSGNALRVGTRVWWQVLWEPLYNVSYPRALEAKLLRLSAIEIHIYFSLLLHFAVRQRLTTNLAWSTTCIKWEIVCTPCLKNCHLFCFVSVKDEPSLIKTDRHVLDKHLTQQCIKCSLYLKYVLTLPWEIWSDRLSCERTT